MNNYHKINNVFERDRESKKLIFGNFSCAEYAYLAHSLWTFTEKIDGTNIKIHWDGQTLFIGGRTNKSVLPYFLNDKLKEIFTEEKASYIFGANEVTLYGEGYGNKIQSLGEKYIPDGVSFILFDIFWNNWMNRNAVDSIAKHFEIRSVPVVGHGNIYQGIELVESGLKSFFGDFYAEGIVARPSIELNYGHRRVITKIKHCDFYDKGVK